MAATININGFQLHANEIQGVKMYVQIKRKTYSNIKDFEQDRAKTIISFMRSIYLSEHPFDELEQLNNIYKESTDVATLLFPKTDELKEVIEVLINFNNMLALCRENYTCYQSKTLALDESQTKLIRSKAKAVFKEFGRLQLTSAASENTVKLLSAIDTEREAQQRNSAQLSRRKEYLIVSINYYTKARGVDLYLIKIKGG